MSLVVVTLYFGAKINEKNVLGGITSLLFMLWSSIGGNVSRLAGITVYAKKDVSIEGCPSDWNVTLPNVAAVENSNLPAEEVGWYFIT